MHKIKGRNTYGFLEVRFLCESRFLRFCERQCTIQFPASLSKLRHETRPQLYETSSFLSVLSDTAQTQFHQDGKFCFSYQVRLQMKWLCPLFTNSAYFALKTRRFQENISILTNISLQEQEFNLKWFCAFATIHLSI